MVAIIISVVAMVLLVAIDLLSKYLIVSTFGVTDQLAHGHDYMSALAGTIEPIELIPGVLRFKLVVNDGAMMGMLDNARWVFMVLSTVAIIAVFVYLFWKKPQNKLQLISLTLITAGGIGNMVDRSFLGYVIDFIDFCAFPQIWKWTFNFADSCVTVGAVMLALWMLIDLVKDTKKKKLEEALAAANAEGNAAEGSADNVEIDQADEWKVDEPETSDESKKSGEEDGEA